MLRGVLDREPRLVGVLAEVDLERVGRAGQHVDVGAGAEDLLVAAGDHARPHLRVLEAEPLDGVGQLDVDAQVVAVALQLQLRVGAAEGRDLHRQPGDLAFDREGPVAVAGRVRVERELGRGGRRVHRAQI